MASTEDRAYEIMRELDVDYVLVIFGGLTGYSSDGRWKITLSLSISYNMDGGRQPQAFSRSIFMKSETGTPGGSESIIAFNWFPWKSKYS